jgi:signal transduction histidine kinase
MWASWRKSLEGRLVFRLAVLLLAALTVGLLATVIASYRAAEELSNEALAHEFVAEVLSDGAWFFPVFALLVLIVAARTIRSALKPIHAASDQAAAIAPGVNGVRLPTDDLPSELAPLVAAINEALQRLESGFEVQRQFTANAAHELRTPLAILTAALETLDDTPEVERLRLDAQRMNRIVAQLLRVARLDGPPMVRHPLDLRATAAQVVEHLAPWAATIGRRLAFEAPDGPVWVLGNHDALADALRNLVENAVGHTPVDTEVLVRVEADGGLLVSDAGPGVLPEHRERVFDRFWRAPSERAAGTGAGLGLAIVAEIARAHDGAVTVSEADSGGAVFRISLPVHEKEPHGLGS